MTGHPTGRACGGSRRGHAGAGGRRALRRGAAAVLVTLTALLAACSPDEGPDRDRTAATPGATPPATTVETADKLLRRYLAAMRDPSSETLAKLEGGAARAVHDAELRFTESSVPRLAAEFAIPRLTGYPKWFAAGAVRPGMTGEVALFVKSRKGAAWRVHHLAYLTHPMPELARDAEGYVTAAEPGDLAERQAKTFARELGTSAAAEADEEEAATAGGGDPETALRATLRQHARLFTGYAWTVRHQAASQGRSYALRTADGGSVVWYVLAYSFTATNSGGRFEITLADEAARLLKGSTVRRALSWEARYQSVAHAQADGTARVLGIALPGWTAIRGD